jgi:Phage integrase, N-terminal SAM-like domain
MLLAAKHGPALTMRKNRPSGSDSQRTESSAGRVAEDPPSSTASPQPRKLLDRVRWHLRVKRYSIRTEQAYVDWIRRFILFHKKRWSQPLAAVKSTFDFIKRFRMFVALAAASGGSALSR